MFFQLPRLPELMLSAGNYNFIARAFSTPATASSAFGPAELALYKEAAGQPGALQAAINYYRALTRPAFRSELRRIEHISAPTLLIWGKKDHYLNISLTRGLESWIDDLRVELIDDVGHWVQTESQQRVSELLIEFLGGNCR